MLVERTFSVVKNTTGDKEVCILCPINEVCLKFVDRQSGEVITERVDSFSTQSFDYRSIDFVKEHLTKPQFVENLSLNIK